MKYKSTDIKIRLADRRTLNQKCLDALAGKPKPSSEIWRRDNDMKRKKAFAEWEKWAYKTLASYFHSLREWREKYSPKHLDEALHPLFVEALTKQDYIEYILDAVFICGDMSEKTAFYRESLAMVEHIARRMEKERGCYARGIVGYDNPSGIVFPFEYIAAVYAEKAA